MRETGIHGIVVNSRIINVFRKEIETLNAERKTAKKKSGDFPSQTDGATRLTIL